MVKNVLFFIESLKIGGAERALTTLLRHIDTSKYDVTVLTIVDRGELTEIVKSIPNIKYKFIVSSRSSFFNKLKIKLIYKWLSARNVYRLFVPKIHDVEIAFCEGLTTKIIGASSNHKAKHIAWVHTDLKENNWPINGHIYSNLNEEIICYSNFDIVVGVSDTVCSRLRSFLVNDKIYRIYNIVDTEQILKESRKPANYLPQIGKLNIVSVGRLEYVKGYDRLIRVMARLANEYKDFFTLTIIGEGSQHQELTKIIKDNSLENVVTLIGKQMNPYSIIARMDLFVCASRNEGFNIAITEAMALGLPVISTWCPGPNELLGDGDFGIICENDEDSLYSAIKLVLEDIRKIGKYSQISKERLNLFNPNKIITQVNAII